MGRRKDFCGDLLSSRLVSFHKLYPGDTGFSGAMRGGQHATFDLPIVHVVVTGVYVVQPVVDITIQRTSLCYVLTTTLCLKKRSHLITLCNFVKS